MKELPSLNTKHLFIYCSSADGDPESISYSDEEAPWRYPWYITLKNKSSTLVGIFRFDGPPVNGRVLLKVDEDRSYIDSDFAAEALNEICSWVYSRKDAVIIKVHHIPDDEKYHKLLKECGFRPDKEDPTVAHRKKNGAVWKMLFTGAGMCIGIAVASLITHGDTDSIIGIFPGAGIGLIAGAIFDNHEMKHIDDIIYGNKYPMKSDENGEYKE